MKDLTGQEFGYWAVMRYVPPPSIGKKGNWLCHCICGKEQLVRGESLRKGLSRSCGCKSIEFLSKARSKPNNHRIRNEIYRNYRRAAKRRGYSFELSFDEFSILISQNCHYCNEPPETLWHDEFASKASEFYSVGDFYYNGVDRVDNTMGYITGNCVTACSPCNRAKSTMTLEQWLRWVKRLYEHQKKKGTYAEVES
jgi:hypothetical protein